jgi:hypothetical protein
MTNLMLAYMELQFYKFDNTNFRIWNSLWFSTIETTNIGPKSQGGQNIGYDTNFSQFIVGKKVVNG